MLGNAISSLDPPFSGGGSDVRKKRGDFQWNFQPSARRYAVAAKTSTWIKLGAAAIVGMSRTSYSSYERDLQRPSVEVLPGLAEFLEISH